MTGLERIRSAVRFEPADSVPVAPLLGAHAVRLAGASFDLACRNAEVQANALLHAAETYRPDAIFTLMDLSAEPEALGAGISFGYDGAPVVSRHLPPEALLSKALDEMVLTARVPVFAEVVSRLREALGESVMVGALISGPLTAAANAVGIEPLARMLRRERDLVSAMLERLARACTLVASRHIEAGAHGVMVLEPCATSSILGPRDLEALLLPRLRAISQHIRSADAVAMLHVCGGCQTSVPLLADSGFEVLSLDSPVGLRTARRDLGRHAALMGNLDVRFLLPRAPAQCVHDAAAAVIEGIGGRTAFVLSGGCELPPETPADNVRELIAAARR